MVCDTTRVFNATSEEYIIVHKKNATIMNFQDILDHGHGSTYLLALRIYARLKHAIITDLEGKSPKREMLTNLEVA